MLPLATIEDGALVIFQEKEETFSEMFFFCFFNFEKSSFLMKTMPLKKFRTSALPTKNTRKEFFLLYLSPRIPPFCRCICLYL